MRTRLALFICVALIVALPATAQVPMSVSVDFEQTNDEGVYLFRAQVKGADDEVLSAPAIKFAAGTPAIAETVIDGTRTVKLQVYLPVGATTFEYRVELYEGEQRVQLYEADIDLE